MRSMTTRTQTETQMQTETQIGRVKFLLIAAMVFCTGVLGAGCGHIGRPSSNDDNKAQQVSDSEVLKARYTLLTGTYRGTLENTLSDPKLAPTPATLRFYIKPVQNGVYSDGTPRVFPELHAQFHLDEITASSDYTDMKGDYDERGGVNLTSDTGPGTGGQPSSTASYIALVGTVFNGQVNRLEIKHNGGTWGYFTGKRTTAESSAPAEGDVEQNRERLRKIYATVEGIYTGAIRKGRAAVHGIEIVVSTDIILDPATGNLNPALRARYTDTSVEPGWGIGVYQMRVDYNSQTGSVSMTSTDPDQRQPGSARISVLGTLRNKVLDADVHERGGLTGHIHMSGR